jgi:hypothetical protein
MKKELMNNKYRGLNYCQMSEELLKLGSIQRTGTILSHTAERYLDSTGLLEILSKDSIEDISGAKVILLAIMYDHAINVHSSSPAFDYLKGLLSDNRISLTEFTDFLHLQSRYVQQYPYATPEIIRCYMVLPECSLIHLFVRGLPDGDHDILLDDGSSIFRDTATFVGGKSTKAVTFKRDTLVQGYVRVIGIEDDISGAFIGGVTE